MADKDWILSEPAPKEWQEKFPDVPALTRQLLWNREIHDVEAVTKFLHPSYEKDLHDPFLFRDMEKVVTRLFLAIEKKEKIFVYGDYDADGVPGAVILKTTLEALGAVTDIYIPHREKEGYGLNSGAIRYMQGVNGKVVITCDCGISNAKEVNEAQEKGLEVIITDHHRIPEVVPKAFAILHPLLPGEPYPNKFLTGGGVAFKLAQGLVRKCKMQNVKCKMDESFEKWLLDLVAISTVADVGKLRGENRTLVKYGLMVLNKTRRIGLQKLMDVAGIKTGALDTYAIGWQIAPRINAAGRMDHANVAFAVLTTQDPAEAEQLAAQLNEANVARQKETDRALKEARAQIAKCTEARPPEEPEALPPKYLLAAYNPSWNPGVIGLVAGRLCEEFRRPVLIATRNTGGTIVASARSIAEFNIIEALASSRKFLEKFGGHPKAAGFSIASEEQWNALIAHLQILAAGMLHGLDVKPSLTVDADLMLTQINWELVDEVQGLEPYGEGNPQPRFLVHGLSVLGFNGVGNGGKHLRLRVTDDTRRPAQIFPAEKLQSGRPQKMIGFNCGEWCKRLKVGDLIDVVVEVGVNEWNGNREIELKIVDLRFHQV